MPSYLHMSTNNIHLANSLVCSEHYYSRFYSGLLSVFKVKTFYNLKVKHNAMGNYSSGTGRLFAGKGHRL